MKVWIDLTDFMQWSGVMTGIQRVQYNLSKLFQDDKSIDSHYFIYKETTRSFIEIKPNFDSVIKNGIALENSSKYTNHISRIIKIVHPQKIKLFKKSDIVLVTGGMWTGSYIDDISEAKKNIGFKLVHFIYDMIPTYLPAYVVDWLPEAFTNYNRKLFEVAENIICISESTRRDSMKFIKDHNIINKPKFDIIRIGDEINKVVPRPVDAIKHGDKFILSVSTFEARKNYVGIYYAVKLAKSHNIQIPKIVIVGRKGWQTDDIRYIISKDPETKNSILHLSEIDDRQLAWLYKHCLFTIFPSFYEGWGMPIAESLIYGKLCLSSNTSSMKEIGGDLVDYFSPYDTRQILEKILEANNEDYRARRENQITEQYKPTPWNKTFTQIKSVLSSLL